MMNIIINFLLSLGFLVITLLIISIPGFFLSIILIPEKYRDTLFWPIMPFLGFSIIIVIIQTCVYLDVPISLSAFPFIILVITGIILIYLKKRSFDVPKLPHLLIVSILLVLAVNGIGYFFLGPSNYIGYGWIDQYNYVTTSQFLMDKPFSMSLDQVGNVPYLVEGIIKKDDRIGQCVLQGFIAVVTGTNAKTVYGAISLLSPLLTFFSILLLSPYFIKDRRFQYGAAISASCMPGFALIHMQDFLSQALTVPFILISPFIIYLALKEKSWQFVVIGILILAAIHAIYTEFTVIFIVLAICGGAWYLIQTKELFGSIAVIGSIVIGGLLINYGYLGKSITLLSRGNSPNFLPHIFPFSESVEGLGYLWFGYSGPLLNYSILIFIVNFCAVILTLAGYMGIVSAVRKQKDVVTALLLIIIILPFIFLCQAEPYPYQLFKMMMTISPVLMLGVWALLSDFWEVNTNDNKSLIKEEINPIFHHGPRIFLVFLLLTSLCITGYLTTFSINGGNRSFVTLTNSDDLIPTYNMLEETKNQSFIVSVSHPYPLAWVTYHGRNNRIFFPNDRFGDVPLNKIYLGQFSFNNITQFPVDAKKLIIGAEYPQIFPKDLSDHLISIIDNPQGIEGKPGSEFNWLGSQMNISFSLLGEKDKNIFLSYLSDPGPGEPNITRIVNVSMIEGKIQPSQIIETKGKKIVSVPLIIQPGLNIVELKTVFPEKASVFLPNEPRELLIHISQMNITERL